MQTTTMTFAIHNVPVAMFDELAKATGEYLKTEPLLKGLAPEITNDMDVEFRDMINTNRDHTMQMMAMMLSFYNACAARKNHRNQNRN